jgi:hypothetical protein
MKGALQQVHIVLKSLNINLCNTVKTASRAWLEINPKTSGVFPLQKLPVVEEALGDFPKAPN